MPPGLPRWRATPVVAAVVLAAPVAAVVVAIHVAVEVVVADTAVPVCMGLGMTWGPSAQ
jgi:hypothetical protein